MTMAVFQMLANDRWYLLNETQEKNSRIKYLKMFLKRSRDNFISVMYQISVFVFVYGIFFENTLP